MAADESKSKCLETARVITHELLEPPKPAGPWLSYTTFRLLKGAVQSFQAWQDKSPETVGIVLGKNNNGCKIVASRSHSMRGLMDHASISRLCQQDGLVPCGFLVGPSADKVEAQELLEQLLGKSPLSICMFVTWLDCM